MPPAESAAAEVSKDFVCNAPKRSVNAQKGSTSMWAVCPGHQCSEGLYSAQRLPHVSPAGVRELNVRQALTVREGVRVDDLERREKGQHSSCVLCLNLLLVFLPPPHESAY